MTPSEAICSYSMDDLMHVSPVAQVQQYRCALNSSLGPKKVCLIGPTLWGAECSLGRKYLFFMVLAGLAFALLTKDSDNK